MPRRVEDREIWCGEKRIMSRNMCTWSINGLSFRDFLIQWITGIYFVVFQRDNYVTCNEKHVAVLQVGYGSQHTVLLTLIKYIWLVAVTIWFTVLIIPTVKSKSRSYLATDTLNCVNAPRPLLTAKAFGKSEFRSNRGKIHPWRGIMWKLRVQRWSTWMCIGLQFFCK
jgi:hypothetical protein